MWCDSSVRTRFFLEIFILSNSSILFCLLYQLQWYRACADSYFLSHCPHQCSTKEQAKKTYAGILKHSSVHGVRGEAKLDQQVVRPKKRLSFNFTHHQQRYDVHDHYEDVDSVAEVSTVFQDTLMPF